MNKKNLLETLNSIANSLEESGFTKESSDVTNVMVKIAQNQTPLIAPISRPNQQTYGYQAAVDKWIQTNQIAVNNALQSPKPMQTLASLLMNVQPPELANAIRVKIGQMKQGME